MGNYQLRRDHLNRVQADITDDVTVGIKVLAVTDERRIERGVHAYCVMDVRTSLGVIRIRDIQIKWSITGERYFLRWRQWPTGKMRRVEGGEDRKEFLDVAGPLDPETRNKFGMHILEVFEQITSEAAAGTLGRQNPGLAELKAKLVLKDAESAPEAAEATPAEGEEAVQAEGEEAVQADAAEAPVEG